MNATGCYKWDFKKLSEALDIHEDTLDELKTCLNPFVEPVFFSDHFDDHKKKVVLIKSNYVSIGQIWKALTHITFVECRKFPIVPYWKVPAKEVVRWITRGYVNAMKNNTIGASSLVTLIMEVRDE